MSEFWQAALLAVLASLLIALIEIPFRSKATVRACCGVTFWLYLGVIAFGNVVTSLIALTLLKASLPAGLENWHPLFAAFAGVFAFEAVLGNTNITVFDKGVLTIQDWVSKARDVAVEAAIARNVSMQRAVALATTERLMQLPEDKLNAHILQCFGAGSVAALEEAAKANKSDSKYYKALELATKEPVKGIESREPDAEIARHTLSRPGVRHVVGRRNTGLPPTTVSTTRASRISSGGISKMLRSSITKSASRPGAIVPLRSSSNDAYAPADV